MAAQKKKKQLAKPKRAAARKAPAAKRAAKTRAAKTRAVKTRATKKRVAGKKTPAAKSAVKKSAARKKPIAQKASGANLKKAVRAKRPAPKKRAARGAPERIAAIDRGMLESRSGLQSGDLQGLRETETADSESVTELLEEGNSFEAGIVAGVERAGDDAEQEVHTHEVPEDDAPDEYLDED